MDDIREILKQHGGHEICPSTATYLKWLTEKLHKDGSLPEELEVDHEFFPDKGDVQLLLLKRDATDEIGESELRGFYTCVQIAYKTHRDEYNQSRKV